MLSRRCAEHGVLVFGLLVGIGGCGDPYVGDFHYRPNPYSTTLSAEGNGVSDAVEVLVSIRGVRKVEDGDGAVLRARLNLTNLADRPVRFEPGSLVLYSADLQRFEDPETTPAEGVTLEPGESRRVAARFPFPGGLKPDELDMSGLSLRWAVRIDEERLTRNATFNRVWRERYYAAPRYDAWDRHFYGRGRGGVYFRHSRRWLLD